MPPFLLASLLSLFAHAELVDRIVSVVGDEVVTLTELERERELAERDVSPTPPFEDQDDILLLYEDYRVILAQLADSSFYRPERRALDARLAAFRASFVPTSEYLDFKERWGASEATLETLFQNRMVAEAYVAREVGLRVKQGPGEPEALWRQRYLEAYEGFMEPLRADVGVRRIELRGEP